MLIGFACNLQAISLKVMPSQSHAPLLQSHDNNNDDDDDDDDNMYVYNSPVTVTSEATLFLFEEGIGSFFFNIADVEDAYLRFQPIDCSAL